jgi:L-fuconate dehydratase
MTTITNVRVLDVRFPTSEQLDGSDAMNPNPDYSAAYVILETDVPGLSGHGLTFTIGRGNEICCAAIASIAPLVLGLELEWIKQDGARFWHRVTSDSQLRWIGPEKGAIHLATGAIVNAAWDLWAKSEGKPLWELISDMSPEEIVRLIDFRYISDCIEPREAVNLLRDRAAGKEERRRQLLQRGYPCYTTSAGWLGYSDEKLRRLCTEAVKEGFNHIKLKVGASLDDDIRRVTIAREVIGGKRQLMIDANQVWEVGQAIDWVNRLKFADPWFIEEPTSPDDVLGHRVIREGIAPVEVATGEMCQNRILFKQFIMSGAIGVAQIDACRLGGVNEVLAVLLMAAKYDLPVCPHAGGVGLCEYVQHLAMIDLLCFAGTAEGRVAEYVDHLHEHFKHPSIVRDAAYVAPRAPGYSIEMKEESLSRFLHSKPIDIPAGAQAGGSKVPSRHAAALK